MFHGCSISKDYYVSIETEPTPSVSSPPKEPRLLGPLDLRVEKSVGRLSNDCELCPTFPPMIVFLLRSAS